MIDRRCARLASLGRRPCQPPSAQKQNAFTRTADSARLLPPCLSPPAASSRPSSNRHLRKSASSSCTRAPVPLVREASGRLAPTRASDVRARVPGVLQKRIYKEGSMVKEGDPLVLIDTAPYRAALAQANAALEQAEASATNAKVAADRNRELAKQNLVSRMQLDDAAGSRAIHGGASVRGARCGHDRAHQPRLRHHHLAHLWPRRPDARARRCAGRAGRGDAANYRRAGRSHLRVLRSAGDPTSSACSARRLRAT